MGLLSCPEAAADFHRSALCHFAACNFIDQPAHVHDTVADFTPVANQEVSPQEPDRPGFFQFGYAAAMFVLAIAAGALFVKLRWYRLKRPRPSRLVWPIALLVLFAAMFFAQSLGWSAAQWIFADGIEGRVERRHQNSDDVPRSQSEDESVSSEALRKDTQERAIVYAAGLPVLIFAFWFRRRARRKIDIASGKTALLRAAVIGVGAFLIIFPVAAAVGIVGQFISFVIFDRWPGPLAHETLALLLEADASVWRIFMIALVVIATPVFEEMMFRGLLQEGVKQLTGSPWLAIFATSALFMLMHVGAVPPESRHALFSLLVLSIGFGWIYERTGSLVAPIVVHAIFNFVNVTIALSIAYAM